MSKHAAAEASVNTVTAGPRSKGRAPKSAMAGKRKMVALTAAVVFVGGVTACSSSTSAPEPQASASEATAIPADVISAYMEAMCVYMGTYDEATVTCDNDGRTMTWEEIDADLGTAGWANLLSYQYQTRGTSADDYRDCPSRDDLRASEATYDDDSPPISDECLTTVLIEYIKELKGF